MGVGVQHCSGMAFPLRFTRFISESKCFSSSDDFTVQFVGHSGTAVASDPYRSFSCLWCFWWDYINTRLWVGICGRFHFCNRTIGKRQLFGCTGHWGKLKLVSSEHCLRYIFIPLHAKWWQDFTKLLLLILQSCVCSLLCVIYVLNHMFGHAHTHVSSVCFTHYFYGILECSYFVCTLQRPCSWV